MSPDQDPGREGTGSGGARSGDPYEPLAWEDDPARESTSTHSASASTAPAASSGATAADGASTSRRSRRPESPNMLPARGSRRSGFERLTMRLIATCGIVAIGVAIAAIMVSSHSQGWVVGLVVSIVTVILAAVLWSSKSL